MYSDELWENLLSVIFACKSCPLALTRTNTVPGEDLFRLIDKKVLYGLPLFPFYHPASVIYRRELKEIYLADIEKLKRFHFYH